MKYALPLLVISSLLGSSICFDMKYSFLKDYWHTVVSNNIADDKIDGYVNYGIYFKYGNKIQSLKSTDLAGGIALGTYILVANFELQDALPSCIFSIKRKGNQKLALCFEPECDKTVTMTLYSANIPDGKMTFAHKITKKENNKFILSVTNTGVTLLQNCEVIEENLFESKNTKQVHLTDEMELNLVQSLTPGQVVKMDIDDLDLYSPVDVTTLMTLCPDLPSAQTRGEKEDNGRPGEKGDKGSRGDTGKKGEVGERGFGLIGPHGEKGSKGDRGDKGDHGFSGLPGLPGMKGERGVGEKGERGEPGMPAPPAPACSVTAVSPAATAELDALKSMLSDVKSIFNTYVLEKTEQTKYFIELNTKCQERLTAAELNIEALKNAMHTEAQL